MTTWSCSSINTRDFLELVDEYEITAAGPCVNVSFPVCHPRPTPACPAEPLPSPWTTPRLKHPLRALHTATAPISAPAHRAPAVLTPTSQLHQDHNRSSPLNRQMIFGALPTFGQRAFRWCRVYVGLVAFWSDFGPKVMKRVWMCMWACLDAVSDAGIAAESYVYPCHAP